MKIVQVKQMDNTAAKQGSVPTTSTNTGNKRKVDGVSIGAATTVDGATAKYARSETLTKDGGTVALACVPTESVVGVFAMCMCSANNRLNALPAKDPIMALSIVHCRQPKIRPPIAVVNNLSNVTHTVLFHGTSQPARPVTKLTQGTIFQRCTSELEMLYEWKLLWDAYNPDVVVGHQIKLFDLWYIIKRGELLKVPNIALLGKNGVLTVVGDQPPTTIIAGEGGSCSYPITSRASKRKVSDTALKTGMRDLGVGATQVSLSSTPQFSRRLDIAGRRINDIWETLQGRFSLKSYEMRLVATNFLVKQDDSNLPEFQPNVTDPASPLPIIAASFAIGSLSIMRIVSTLPDFVAFCFRCKQPGHDAKHCVTGVVCKGCGEVGDS